MALSREQKESQVKELTQKMSEANSIMFANFIGLSVSEVSELRGQLKEADAEMKVAKKTLTQLAAKDAALPEFKVDDLEGPISIIFSFGDPLSGAQVAFKFGKDHEQVKLIGGVFDGKVLTLDEAVELAKMPSRDVLLATFVGMIRSPLTSFASMCSSPLSGFARALKEMADKGGFTEEKADSAPQATQNVEKAEEKDATTETPETSEAAPEEPKEEQPES